MGIRKIPLRQLARWSQIRQRGERYHLMGRFADGDVVMISMHATLAEANAMASAYMGARESDGSPQPSYARLDA